MLENIVKHLDFTGNYHVNRRIVKKTFLKTYKIRKSAQHLHFHVNVVNQLKSNLVTHDIFVLL